MATIVGNQFLTAELFTSGASTPFWINFDGNSKKDSNLTVNLVGNVAVNKQNACSSLSSNQNARVNQTGNIE